MVKVLDGCGMNGKCRVLCSAPTGPDWPVLVTDNATGVTPRYRRNGADQLIVDVAAFRCHS